MFIGVNNKARIINQIFVGVDGKAKLIYSGNGSGSFELPTFTGSHSIFGDEKAGRIEIYESGTLVLNKGTYDFFLVGGGASGKGRYNHNGYSYGGGGGGGYTKVVPAVKIGNSTNFEITVGAGGNAVVNGAGAGGKTSIRDVVGLITHEVSGGKGVSSALEYDTSYGGNGGSGGGAGSGYDTYKVGCNGGSDGSDGVGYGYSGSIGGKGQGSTTRMFGQPEGTLYAGGGGGDAASNVSAGVGGAGGGGSRSAGAPNTGGGGGGRLSTSGHAGGSGIVIIRWNNT